MLVRVGIENNNDNRSIAWALEHPGCYAYGLDAAQAQNNFQPAAVAYAAWIGGHGTSWLQPQDIRTDVEETFEAYRIPRDPGGDSQVESFFRYDQEPLTGIDVERAIKLLDWSRRELLDVLKGLDDGKLNQAYEGERWSINGILKHISGSEWWYQERIGFPFPEREEDLPTDSIEALEMVRAHFISLLPRLEGLHLLRQEQGEMWSPRKVLRRAAWHERDHTDHIRKLL